MPQAAVARLAVCGKRSNASPGARKHREQHIFTLVARRKNVFRTTSFSLSRHTLKVAVCVAQLVHPTLGRLLWPPRMNGPTVPRHIKTPH